MQCVKSAKERGMYPSLLPSAIAEGSRALIYVPIITTFEKKDKFEILPEIFNTNRIRT